MLLEEFVLEEFVLEEFVLEEFARGEFALGEFFFTTATLFYNLFVSRRRSPEAAAMINQINQSNSLFTNA